MVLLSSTAEMHAMPAEAEARIAHLDQRMVAVGSRAQASPIIELPLREQSHISRMPLAVPEPQLARALSASVVMTGAQKVIAVLLLALVAVGLVVATLYTLIGLITLATLRLRVQ